MSSKQLQDLLFRRGLPWNTMLLPVEIVRYSDACQLPTPLAGGKSDPLLSTQLYQRALYPWGWL